MVRKSIYLLLAAWILSGCLAYPDETADISEFDTVTTLFDRSTDLTGYITYALSDTIVPVTPDTNNIGIPAEIFEPDGPVTDYILDRVEANMDRRGYTRVTDPEAADLLINAGYVVLTNTVLSTYYCDDWWLWFFDDWWYGPAYNWGYPSYGYYYPYSCTYSYTYDVGTVLIQMLDGKDINFEEELFTELWLGVFRGFAFSGVSYDRIEFAVDQAFAQTPFFNPTQN